MQRNIATTDFVGFDVASPTALSNNFLDCTTIANTSTGTSAPVASFRNQFSNTFGTMINCTTLNNAASGTTSTGIGLDILSTDANWNVINCRFLRSTGTSNSFGVRLPGSPGANLFTKVIAYNNGTVHANQLSNVPATSNMNTAIGSWAKYCNSTITLTICNIICSYHIYFKRRYRLT